jgi:hypothetical protein
MPQVYRAFVGQTQALHGAVFNALSAESDMRQTPGGRIMLERRPLNFPQLFRAYIDAYQGIWTWNPGPKTPGGGDVLDGVGAYGQCASFVRGLHLLATAPKPYGLDLGNQIEIVRYNGFLNAGFISPHAGTHFGLQSNVLTPGVASTFAPLYYWDNHYVIKYLGRFYDPSYDEEYTSLDEMATYELKPGTIERGTDAYEAAQAKTASIVYFKQRLGQLGNRKHAVEGPFASLP